MAFLFVVGVGFAATFLLATLVASRFTLINAHQSLTPASNLQLYVYLRLTSVVEPDLKLAKSEQVFVDPKTGGSAPFPRAAVSPPSLYLSLVVPAYKEQDRCEAGVLFKKYFLSTPFPLPSLLPSLPPSLLPPPLPSLPPSSPATVPKMMRETMEYLCERQERESDFQYEVIVVNDGSRDRTVQEALKFVEEYGTGKVRLLDLASNRGKGGAVRMVSSSSSSSFSSLSGSDGMCGCGVLSRAA